MRTDSLQVTIAAGPHDRRDCPVAFRLPEGLAPDGWELAHPDDGATLPLQTLSGGSVAFVLPALRAGTTLTLGLRRTNMAEARRPRAVTVDDDGRSLSVAVAAAPLTTYHYADVPARPYFYPLLTAAGQEVTRAYPMRTDIPGESNDHPHHRSLWIAFGDVNGADNWSEETGHASTRHDAVSLATGGDVCGQFATHSTWLSPGGRPLLQQSLHVTAWATPAAFRLLDFEIDLTAEQESIVFGDTKEGGILSVRVVGSMDVPRGGRIENSYGGVDEAETWGKAAHWCDYSGPVDGDHCGIAVMDHPLSFRYPTHWHVRDYGLMTANPFGYAAYTGGAKRGEHRLERGETLRFRYRLLVHDGDAASGRVRERYLDYVSPPTVKIARLETISYSESRA
jgi:hypothetical protein